MKALTLVEPGRAEVCEIPTPRAGPGEVLLRVRYVGFCGSDLNTFRGLNPMVTYPRIPGHEIGATIEALGPDVPPTWASGQAVTVSPYSACGACSACRRGRSNCCRRNQTLGVQRDGALTEFIVVPHTCLVGSARLSPRELALVEPLTVGFHAARRGEVAAGDTVAVLGCGAIGLGALAGAVARGASVTAVDIDDAKLALARRAGAAGTVNSRAEDLHVRLAALNDGEGPDVVIEAIGLPQTFLAAVSEVAFAGRVVYIGYAKAPVCYETRLFVQKELDIRGSRNAERADFEAVVGCLEAGRFPIDAMISRTVRLDAAGQALANWAADPGKVARILCRLD